MRTYYVCSLHLKESLNHADCVISTKGSETFRTLKQISDTVRFWILNKQGGGDFKKLKLKLRNFWTP